jgi:lipopolysaccharide/colanic/teichoic acid biosynthesis glycosyltransferase
MTTTTHVPASPSGLVHTDVCFSSWNHSTGKRLFDLSLAFALLAAFLPLMLLIALIVKLTSGHPVLFRQQRVGKNEQEFELIKFRTMTYARNDSWPKVTREGDGRITSAGRVLRKWKLDELPQLLNVVRGDMSLVGPRPDVREFLDTLQCSERRILCLRPGVTGSASLRYRNEEQLLSTVPRQALKEFYCTTVLPDKIRIDSEYARKATFVTDLAILLLTLKAVLT